MGVGELCFPMVTCTWAVTIGVNDMGWGFIDTRMEMELDTVGIGSLEISKDGVHFTIPMDLSTLVNN